MGRSRGGLTTKIHALVDAEGLPIALKLTEGQAHDGRAAVDMLASLRQGDILLGDAAYDSDVLRQDLAARGAWACVKPMPHRRSVPAFSSFLYRYRNLVERFFNKIKQCRRVATRYDKLAANYLAFVQLASIRLHGAPLMYYSAYEPWFLSRLADAIAQSAATEVWCIFDNTASGAATANALEIQTRLCPSRGDG